MAKLTKQEAKHHHQAAELLKQYSLSHDEKEFFRTHWQEGGESVNTSTGAFFTPWEHALDFALEVPRSHTEPVRIIDLCAGIGNLSAAIWERQTHERLNGAPPVELVCVELNPAYVDIGKKLLPEATWVQSSVFDLPELGHFDAAISNPPFGKLDRHGGNAPRYTGAEFDYHVVDIAANIADFGAFILPSMSAPFRYSGAPYYDWKPSRKYESFNKQTGIDLHAGLGVDTSVYRDQWHGVAPATEHCIAFFDEWRETKLTREGALFDVATDQSDG